MGGYGHCPAKASGPLLASFFIISNGTLFCPQVPNSLCSSLTLAFLGSAFVPLLCSLASLGKLTNQASHKYTGNPGYTGFLKNFWQPPTIKTHANPSSSLGHQQSVALGVLFNFSNSLYSS